jgi:hypothetical protein
MSSAYIPDPKLKDWATPRQAELIDAVILHGSQHAAARELGLAQSLFSQAISAVKAKASISGWSPEHDLTKPIAPGYVGKGHSTLYKTNPETGEKAELLQWVKTKADEEARAKLIEAAFAAAAETLPRAAPVTAPGNVQRQLLNLYTITDYHLGMYAWAGETGAAWDLSIAEAMLYAAFAQMIESAPKAGKAVLNIQGDFIHTDGKLPVTPSHGHVLDASGKYAEMVQAAVRVLRRVIALALATHDAVEVIVAEGNHDLGGSLWLRVLLAALYENEPRLKVNQSELPFYVLQFGEVMLAVHHGHQVKNEQLPLLFAASAPAMWGLTTKRYAHCGHRHHADRKEFSGMVVEQHPTLAARDSYAARAGYIAERAAVAITYHAKHGEVGRGIVTPEMLSA